MAEIIGLVTTIVNAILLAVQSCVKKVEDGVQAPFKRKETVTTGTQTAEIRRQCVWPRNTRSNHPM